MESLWNDAEAATFVGDLAQRVYTSRLLGREPALVLHGGGNTSVKVCQRNVFDEDEDILYVKGSGWDLATIEAPGFTPLRLQPTARLAQLPHLADTEMMRLLRTFSIVSDAPAPSVEAILHAILPYKFVDHTHADALLAITNTPDGEQRVRELYGGAVLIVPYVMPGFTLAKACAERFAACANKDDLIGIVLMHHGLVTFGDTARQAYTRMIALVTQAEEYIAQHGQWRVTFLPAQRSDRPVRAELAELRRAVSEAAGAPMILVVQDDDKSLGFARRPDVASIARRGPVTPDHIIRTKRLPLIGRDVATYRAEYEAYFARHSAASPQPLTMLDPAPRVILDPELGMLTAGRSVRDATIAAEVYAQTIDVILRAESLGGWCALPEAELFRVEYWDLEQAKLKRMPAPQMFTGEVALVTGAASGIGKACAQALLQRGAAVVGLDVAPIIESLFPQPEFLGIVADVSDAAALCDALERTSRRYGGLDMLVLNAGIFPASQRIAALEIQAWARTLRINLDANAMLMREAHPLLKLAPRGGRVVVVGSKNVPAPGPGAAAYSASKAALTQLARVAALEWGSDGIRVNVVHPNAVFDTGIWTDEVLSARAQSYGISVEQYKRRNVLGVEVTSRDVGELVAELCSPVFAKTTGAQIPIDGGNERVI
ncbi:MAG: bifunctional aldolase/short-chain dehydrogenase [Candidatus Brachytrichaceae bacterium NZ_4S206]|jgi:rhamnose utilization protein RhaD (predicted bifunctional aldolase and dehydrogenase)/NAD(P)-dependent dehydrogenase (short-subunit alcohol dehydrogenase family)